MLKVRVIDQPVRQVKAGIFLATVLTCLVAAAPPVSAAKKAAFIMDFNSGKVLYSSKADESRYPASLTKMMTLYIVFEMLQVGRLSYDTELLMTPSAARRPPSKLGLKPGGTIKVRDAIRALVTKSANDIASAVAENLAGTEEKFARYMTWKARQLGMHSTVFRNASGLPDSQQLTTARDMATLGMRLIDDFPKQYEFFSLKRFRYNGRSYRNHNGLLFNFQGTDGIKTGYTRASGFNLVASVKRRGRHVIGVVMGERSAGRRNRRMRYLLGKALPRAATLRTREKARPAPQLVAAATTRTTSRTTRRNEKTAQTDAPAKGPFHLQIGAHSSHQDAKRHISRVMNRAGGLLARHKPVVVSYDTAERKWYRARFAGFSRARARQTCSELKKRSIDCVVMQAQ